MFNFQAFCESHCSHLAVFQDLNQLRLTMEVLHLSDAISNSKPYDVLSTFQIYQPFTIIFYRICTWMQSIQHTQITFCGRLPIRQYPLLYLVVLLLTIPVPLSTIQDIVPTVQGS
uniref:Uncharacterized protein n=1 Tax=Magallana gigas TaxID=29159 RepID=K1PQZ9_MAGGI